jgi:signal recognition particle subunit SRP54
VFAVVRELQVPVRFIGTGERLDDLEPFHADRIVSRILGMGDVLSLIEKAEQAVSREEAERLEAKIRANEFTLEDFRDQLRALRRMGPLEQILGLLPGLGHLRELAQRRGELDEREIRRLEAIIDSMTPRERRNHQIIDGSRRRRIARGSGTSVQEVNRLLRQFAEMRRILKVVGGAAGGGGRRDRLRALRSLGRG